MWQQSTGLGRKIKVFLLLLRTKCHKVGLAINTVGPSDMDELLVQLFLGPNEPFWGGRTVGPLWGTFVTRTKCFWDPVSMDWNVRVELSLGPKAGVINVKAPFKSAAARRRHGDPPPPPEVPTAHDQLKIGVPQRIRSHIWIAFKLDWGPGGSWPSRFKTRILSCIFICYWGCTFIR